MIASISFAFRSKSCKSSTAAAATLSVCSSIAASSPPSFNCDFNHVAYRIEICSASRQNRLDSSGMYTSGSQHVANAFHAAALCGSAHSPEEDDVAGAPNALSNVETISFHLS